MKNFLKKYFFLLGMAGILLLAWRVPRLGEFLGAHYGKTIAVVAIFFMSGVTIGLEHVWDDLRNWKCHLLIQGSSFVLIPTAIYLTAGWLPGGALKYGVYLVAVLPTTISSCVVFTAAARGRTSCALVNAVGGNLIGVFVSPLLLGLMIGAGNALDLSSALKTITRLCFMVVLPFVVGQVFGKLWPPAKARLGKVQSVLAQCFILLIMLCAFSKALGEIVQQGSGMWQCFLYLAAAHIVFLIVATALARSWKLSAPESAAVVFCATQKTLALGLPLAAAFFMGSEISYGVVIVPVAFYHLFQLLVAGIVVSYWAKRTGQT